ncbi:MAG: uracil-DNA glycosylase family protein [Rhodospirillaceae bacterium]
MPSTQKSLTDDAAAVATIKRHQAQLARCVRCPLMKSTPVIGYPVVSKVMLVGQAPGAKEAQVHRPFAWTAGKTLFKWFERAGMPGEEAFRRKVYMAAVCRCFPGKNPRGGDRVPSREEIENCSSWLDAELRMLGPELVIAAGKLAIREFLPGDKLDELVGTLHRARRAGIEFDVLPLPHPSGASTWIHMAPGKTLLPRALDLLARHPAWRKLLTAKT